MWVQAVVIKCSITKNKSISNSLQKKQPEDFFQLSLSPSLPGACVSLWSYVMEVQPTGDTAQVKVTVRYKTREARPYKE